MDIGRELDGAMAMALIVHDFAYLIYQKLNLQKVLNILL